METTKTNSTPSFTPRQGVLEEAQVKFYAENGYVVIPKVFTNELCDKALRIYEGHADDDFSSVMNLDREVPAIRDLLKHPRVVDILETLQQSEVYGCQTFFLFKKVGTPYATQAWDPHQDNSYPQAAPGAYITANVAFSEQDPENGGLYIYPGSHKEGLFPYEPKTGHKESAGTAPGNRVAIPEKYLRNKVDLVMNKGDCLFLNGNVLHGSYPNVSKTRSRPMLLMTYIKKGEPFIPGVKAQRGMFPLR